ncbi:charged multivesicular body protein 3-like isoform X2 [Varroa jacobsoni]|uniref:Charged multivesicular body protein 3 n=1 Tax=Varroa destructor TaxID=109461 RepID=A0A7M7KPB2_VARDE|nr:charged multivesicular body protein 3-like isoform X2 [Varroa destructor]XP_022703032.1 charged multivesicular body protein 3-like isoform X2 [Varroa jacobsoni]
MHNHIQREEEKIKKSLKEAAKKGDRDVCNILAREVVRSRKAIARIHVSKTQINSVIMGINHQLATLRVAGSLQKSTDVMKSMQSLVKVPEVAQTMQELSKEMMKAGIIEEIMQDTLDETLDNNEEMEAEAQEEIDKVIFEVTAGALDTAPAAVHGNLEEPASSSKEEEDLAALGERFQALKS